MGKWGRLLESFRIASGLSKENEDSQVNVLIYSMGDTADYLLLSFDLSEADRKKYKPVKDKFDLHFVIKKNVIYERAKFNMRSQKEGEPVDSFITDLYAPVEFCNFGNLRDELIRDRLVVVSSINNCQRSYNLMSILRWRRRSFRLGKKKLSENNRLFSEQTVKSRLIISRVSKEGLINTKVPLKMKEKICICSTPEKL